MPRKAVSIHIGKFCSHKGCTRVGVVAKKLSDFWVVLCDMHQGQKITLDMSGICDTKGNFGTEKTKP